MPVRLSRSPIADHAVHATAEDCANYIVAMFSDLTKRVTMQNLYNDGGFSNMGVSDLVMAQFMEGEPEE